ncbi:MAG: carboxypeptidase regulatory-like domain-containing protein [Acidimicrobiales bacterium]
MIFQQVRRIVLTFLSTALVVISVIGVPAGAATTHVGSSLGGTDLGARLVGGTGIITGTVTNAYSAGIGGVCVYAQRNVGGIGYGSHGTAATTSTGSYTISNLAAGTYFVYFDPSCSGAVTSIYVWQESSALVIVSAGGSTTQNAILGTGGTITGTVTNASDVGIGGVFVTVTHGGGGGYNSATTASNGSYTLSGLPVGTYTVSFYLTRGSTATSPYAPQSSSVIVSAGGTTTQNATLALGGTVTGTVTNASNVGIGNVCVNVVIQLGNTGYYNSVTTASNGSYTISNLPAGTYIVNVDDGSTCVGMLTSPYAQQSIGSVTVSAGGSTTQNATLGVSIGSITGTVTNASNVGIGNVCVYAQSGNDSYGSDVTARGGSYTISALAAGTYTVRFNPCNGLRTYAQQSIGSVTVSAGSTTRNITLAMRALPTTLNVGFVARRSSLDLSQERGLTALAKKLVAGASVVITGYAKANTALAGSRARAVAEFLSSRVTVKIHVTLKTSSSTTADKVTVSTTQP